MKNKYILGGLAVLFLLLTSRSAGAAGIVLKSNNLTLLAANNSALTLTYTGPGTVNTANLEFFSGSVPASPTSTTNRIETFGYTWLAGSGTHQYDETSLNGVNVRVRTWDGPPRTQGSHYGISSSYVAAAGAAPANQYTLAAFKTDYLADSPTTAPTITTVTEANQRVGNTNNIILNLTITYTYNAGTSPNIVPAASYDVKYWFGATEPPDSNANWIQNVSGTSWSLPAADPETGLAFGSGTYHFKVRARNEFGAGPWSATTDWPTLPVGVGGPLTLTLILRSNVGATPAGPGINSFAMPFPGPWYAYSPGVGGAADTPLNVGAGGTNQITNAYHLVRAINAAAGTPATPLNVVSTAGRWNSTSQLADGIMITGNNPEAEPAKTNLEAVALAQGVGYQVYIGNPPGGAPLAAGYTLNLVIKNTAP